MVAVTSISPSKIGQFVVRSKKPIKHGFVEYGKQCGFYIPSGALYGAGVFTGNPILLALAGITGYGTSFYILGRTINRWGKGLFFKFENKVGQEGLEKLSKIDFSKLQGINLNKLAKGKIIIDSKEADEFVKVANDLMAQNKKPNFNILHNVDIFKLSK